MRFVQLVEGEYNEVVLQIRTHTYRKSQQQPLCPHIRARTLEVDNAVEADVPEVLTGSDARVHEQRRAVVCTCRDDDLPARTEDVFRWRLRVGGLDLNFDSNGAWSRCGGGAGEDDAQCPGGGEDCEVRD